MKNLEFSKLLLIIAFINANVISLIIAILSLLDKSTTDLAQIALAVWALVNVATGLYFWKAKAENLIKIGKTIPKEMIKDLEKIKNFVE